MRKQRTRDNPGPEQASRGRQARVTQQALLHDVESVCERLSLSDTTVRRLIWAGELPHVRIGRAVRVTDAAVRVYVASLAGEVSG